MKTLRVFLAVLGWMAGLSCWGQTNNSLPLPDAASIREALQRANDYFLAHDNLQTNGWARGVYHTGNMRAYQLLGIDRYLQSSLNWAISNAWQPGIKGATNADGEVSGQTYIDLYRMDPQPIRIAAVKAGIDSRVASAAATQDWWWVDAIFMAGPTFARFGNLYSTNTYFDKMWLMYDDTKTRRALFDPGYGLWYRDATAQTATTKNGKKQFWGRGNGWVMAALTRVLEEMPASQPHRADYITMLQTMAAALKPLQGTDGMWRSSLIDPAEYPNPETSGTALFTCALAWGLRNGYLDPAVYQSVAVRAWNGMITNALHTNGLVGYVQAQGAFPDSTTYDTTYDFGVGVFLLAGGEMLRLVGGGATAPVLTGLPVSQGVAITSNALFSATALGPAPLRFQWFKDGTPLLGATNTTLPITNAQTSNAGLYTLIITNSFGSTTSAPVNLTVLTLPGALDTPLWTWTTGGSAHWTPENSLAHDGVGAVQSGRISNSQTSWIETTLSGPVTVSFWWKVSSETNNDLLRFFVDRSEQMRISGEVDWHWQSFNLSAGNHTLRWAYSKNSSTTKGQDGGWLDQVSIVCGYALSPLSRDHGAGAETGQISIITSNALCAWSVLNTNGWITITSDTDGAGNGSVHYSLAANPVPVARTGVVMIADEQFTIRQAGPLSLSCAPGKTVECASDWDFDSPTGVTGCPNTSLAIQVVSTVTNLSGSCGNSFSATRTWLAIDGCSNQASCSQTVTVLDTTPPVLTCPASKTVEFGSPWNFDLPTASDRCAGANMVIVQAANTVTNRTGQCGNTFAVTRTWAGTDGCNNRATCSQTVTVVDTTAPVLTCAGNKGVICGTAWTFDEPIGFDLADGTNVTIGVVDTLTNGNCSQNFTAIRTWRATDRCGNSSTCAQTVTNQQLVISGTISYPVSYPASSPSATRLGAVSVALAGDSSQTTQTASDGSFRFVVNAGGNFTVTPNLPASNPPSSGISTFDLALIRRHILGLAFLDSPYAVLAADVNGSKSVTTFDISLVRKMILGMTNSFPSGLWQFAAADYVFPDTQNPWDAPTSRSYTNLLADSHDQDFFGIKLGDVNGSWTPPAGVPGAAAKSLSASARLSLPASPTPAPTVTFHVSGSTHQRGEKVLAKVTVSGFNHVTSVQFTLVWDPAVLRFEGTGDYALQGLGAGSFGTVATDRGELTFSWDDPQASGATLPDGESVFSVSFGLIGTAGDTSALALRDTITEREVGVSFARAGFRAEDGQITIGGALAPQGIATAQTAASSQETNACHQLRTNWFQLLTGGTNYSLSDGLVKKALAGITNTAMTNWTTMLANTTTNLWSDLTNGTNSAEITTSYERLRTLALAYATYGSALRGNSNLAASIQDGLNRMTNRYNTNIPDTKTNWYDVEIGAPLRITDIAVLMYDALGLAGLSNSLDVVAHFIPTPTNGIADRRTGANLADKLRAVALRGAVLCQTTNLVAATNALRTLFPYVTYGDGFYRDGSFIQHTNHPYTGGYGAELLQDLSLVLPWLQGSPWACSDPARTNVVQWVYDAFEPLLYYGAMMDLSHGREVSRSRSQDHQVGAGIVQSILALSQFDTNAAPRLRSMVKYWAQADTFLSFSNNVPLPLITPTEQLLADDNTTSRGELLGHGTFSGMDRVVHLRPGWGFGLSMSSRRISNFESIKNENLKGWFQGDGVTFCYTTNDLGQFSDDFWPTVDPYHLPGTTVEITDRTSFAIGQGYTNGNTWIGGVTLFTNGAAGMDLDPTNSALVGKKSWFMFDSEVVCLGAGITCTNGSNVHTTVENRRLSASNTNAFLVDGVPMPLTLPWVGDLANPSWCALDGVGGYYLPGQGGVRASRETRTHSWSEINGGGTTNLTSRNYLTLFFDHGVRPTNASYAYVLLPNFTSAQAGNYAAHPPIIVLTNSASLQSVKETALDIVAANFWTNATQTIDLITVNKKASVLVRETASELSVAVADPTQTNTGNITVTINRTAIRTNSHDSAITNIQLSPIKFNVNVKGAAGRSFVARFTLPQRPVVTNPTLSSGKMTLRITGDPGPSYLIQISTNLQDWATVATNKPSSLPLTWTDTNPSSRQRFYRVLLAP